MNYHDKSTTTEPIASFTEDEEYESNAYVYASVKARSLMFSTNHIISDSTIYVATPFNALFLMLEPLLRISNKFQSVEDIHDEINKTIGKSNVVTEQMVEQCISVVCEDTIVVGEKYYKFNNHNFIEFIDERCADIISHLPKGLYKRNVLDALTPIDSESQIPDSILKQAAQRLAFGLISSYLESQLTDLYLQAKDFAELDKYISKLGQDKAIAIALRNGLLSAGSKRRLENGNGEPKPATKKPSVKKPKVTNNKSILSFFAKK